MKHVLEGIDFANFLLNFWNEFSKIVDIWKTVFSNLQDFVLARV